MKTFRMFLDYFFAFAKNKIEANWRNVFKVDLENLEISSSKCCFGKISKELEEVKIIRNRTASSKANFFFWKTT